VVVVFARLTVTDAFVDVLVKNVPSPRYLADSAWAPTLKVVVANVATPLFNVDVPPDVAPSKNCTCPVGVPLLEETDAVNVTL